MEAQTLADNQAQRRMFSTKTNGHVINYIQGCDLQVMNAGLKASLTLTGLLLREKQSGRVPFLLGVLLTVTMSQLWQVW